VLAINLNWRYNSHVVEGSQAREFDDSGFEQVTVPHTNLRLPWHSFDDKSYRSVSAYRRLFKLPPETRGGHVFFDCEGVMTATGVWINGQRLGGYKVDTLHFLSISHPTSIGRVLDERGRRHGSG